MLGHAERFSIFIFQTYPMHRTILILFLFAVTFAGCKKDKSSCWQVYDAVGAELGVICGKTEAEIQTLYGPFYDKANAPKFCWKIVLAGGTNVYPENLTEKMAAHWYTSAVSREKITCGYCQGWLTREKWVSKQTGQHAFTPVQARTYCGDTLTTIFPGRIITLRETADSLFYHEFIQKQ